MRDKSFFLMILLVATAASSACWAPKEVRAGREDIPAESTPRTISSPVSETKNLTNVSKTSDIPDSDKNKTPAKASGFKANLPANFQMPTDEVGLRLLNEYGSICLATGGATAPNKIFFRDEADVNAFQSSLQKSSEKIGGFTVELQAAAMNALKKAVAEAESAGKKITPRAADSSKRTYSETVRLWESRVTPGLAHWVAKGRLTQAEADRIKALAPFEQVSEILRLEAQGMYFSKDLSKSILYSVAAPGASQHIFMLALDIEQFADAQVREILARHGWFQTVQSDLPHFTYLGAAESELAAKGLRSVTVSGQKFWVPNI